MGKPIAQNRPPHGKIEFLTFHLSTRDCAHLYQRVVAATERGRGDQNSVVDLIHLRRVEVDDIAHAHVYRSCYKLDSRGGLSVDESSTNTTTAEPC